MSKITIIFLRHAETMGNVYGNFIGRTDMLISKAGRDKLTKLTEDYTYPQVEKIFSSPAIRCLETADIIYPNKEVENIEGFWEMDYGDLDCKNTKEIQSFFGREKWMARAGDCMYPHGESYLELKFRAHAALTRAIHRSIEEKVSKIAIVAHGDILYRIASTCLDTDVDMREFFLTPNGMGYEVTVDTEEWFEKQRISFVQFIPEGAPRMKAEDSPYFKE